jgi:hypothetical protein
VIDNVNGCQTTVKRDGMLKADKRCGVMHRVVVMEDDYAIK